MKMLNIFNKKFFAVFAFLFLIGFVSAGNVVFQDGDIVSDNRVGIGTDSPIKLLDIAMSHIFTGSLARLKNAGTGDASLEFAVSGNSWMQGVDNSDGDKFKLASSNANVNTNTVMTWLSNGKVGVGTYSPNAKFEVYSNPNIDLMRIHTTEPTQSKDLFLSTQVTTHSGTGIDEAIRLNAIDKLDGNAELHLAVDSVNKLKVYHKGVSVDGYLTASVVRAGNGWSGTYATGAGQTVTVKDGIITSVA